MKSILVIDRCGAAAQPQLINFVAKAQQQCNNRLLLTRANADLLAVLAEAKIGSEIDIDVSRAGTPAMTSLREGARIGSVANYLSDRGVRSLQLLHVLLANYLVEKNGGYFVADPTDAGNDMVRMEFPIVEYGNEN